MDVAASVVGNFDCTTYVKATNDLCGEDPQYRELDTLEEIIKNATDTPNADYYIQQGSVLSMDGVSDSNANNSYYMFTKSFIVVIDKQE